MNTVLAWFVVGIAIVGVVSGAAFVIAMIHELLDQHGHA